MRKDLVLVGDFSLALALCRCLSLSFALALTVTVITLGDHDVINGLATLFTGFLHPAALRSIGFIDGDDDALRAAAAIFAGATPWMTDMY